MSNTKTTTQLEFLIASAEVFYERGELLPIHLEAELIEEGVDVEALRSKYNSHDKCEEEN